MTRKTMQKSKKSLYIVLIILILFITFLLNNKNHNIQSIYAKTILTNTCKSISVFINAVNHDNDENIPSLPLTLVDNTSVNTAQLGEILSSISIKQTSSHIKYEYFGEIVFFDVDNSSFQILCFSDNIVKINNRYYTTSSNLLATSETFYTMILNKDEKQ